MDIHPSKMMSIPNLETLLPKTKNNAGTEFHPSARTTVTMTADAEVVRELIERTPDFPKLWNRGFQKPLQEKWGMHLSHTQLSIRYLKCWCEYYVVYIYILACAHIYIYIYMINGLHRYGRGT